MTYSWSVNIHDSEGDSYRDGVLVWAGDSTVLLFKNSEELCDYARAILRSINEIKAEEARLA